jgi:Flp pilus assembly protein TadB
LNQLACVAATVDVVEAADMAIDPRDDTVAQHLADVDALVTALHPGAGVGPAVETRDVILVTGQWLAGSTGLTHALRERLPDRTFVDATELAVDDAPAAVVYVTSAVGPLTESDCVLLDSAAANTDLVIGAVNKIDVHPGWRDVLAANQAVVAAHNARYTDVVWVGVAAAPEVGEPSVDDLVDALEEGMAQSRLPRRNRLRAWQTWLMHAMRRQEDAAAGVGREARVAALRRQRSEVLQQRQLVRAERTNALRSRAEQAKVQLTDFASKRCASVRTELAEDAATMTRRRMPEFEKYAGNRVGEVIREVDAGIGMELSELATQLGLTVRAGERPPVVPPVPPPPLTASRLGARLMMLLGVVLGVGVALALSRLFAHLAPAYTAAGLAAGAAVGLVVAVWVVRMRRLRRDRAALDRWIDDVMGELRAVVEQHVATRVQSAESALTAEQAQRDEAEAANVPDQVAAIDGELREHAVAAVRATARRDRQLPGLQRALDAVRAELDGSAASIGENEN